MNTPIVRPSAAGEGSGTLQGNFEATPGSWPEVEVSGEQVEEIQPEAWFPGI